MKNIKLEIEMIPATNFYNNVRSAVSKTQWDVLRKECYELANHSCEICGDNGLNQGYRWRVESHEVWDFNHKTNTQSLVRLISLCPMCHSAKHIGRTFAIGKQPQIFEHIKKVNNFNNKELILYVSEAFKDHKEKSKQIWTLNLDYLTDKLGVDKKKINLEKASKSKGKQTYYYKATKKKNNVKQKPTKKG